MSAVEQTIRKDWTTVAGLRAVVLMTRMGHHCGYVAVPVGHPLHGVNYSAPTHVLQAPGDDEPIGKRGVFSLIAAAADPSRMQSPELVFDVHGGLTYSDADSKYPAENDGLWWFGYDCGHAGDSASPEYLAEQEKRYPNEPFMWTDYGTFRDLDYCVAECESLARQIAKATGEAS